MVYRYSVSTPTRLFYCKREGVTGMTLEELRQVDREWLTPKQIAGCLGCNPYAINQQAASDAGKLGFPIIMVGRRVKIPKRAFIRFMEGQHESNC